MHTQQRDPFLPPSPQDRPLARRCHSALGIRAGSPQTPGGHSTHKLCPTTKCPEQGGTVGLRAPAAAWAASPCSRSPLESCRDSRGPGRPCLPPPSPAPSPERAPPPTRKDCPVPCPVGGVLVPAWLPLPVAGRAGAHVALHQVQRPSSSRELAATSPRAGASLQVEGGSSCCEVTGEETWALDAALTAQVATRRANAPLPHHPAALLC